MSFVIEIAHPNDVLKDEWTPVDSFDDPRELDDHIASPSFTWERTTIVRVFQDDEIVYVGIYSDKECIRIDNDGEDSIIDIWRNSTEPSNLIDAISAVVDRKFMIGVLLEITRKYTDHRINASVYTLIIEEYLRGDLTARALNIKNSHLYIQEPEPSRLLAILSGIAECTEKPELMASVVIAIGAYRWEISRLSVAKTNKNIANDLRAMVPFYEIALGITK